MSKQKMKRRSVAKKVSATKSTRRDFLRLGRNAAIALPVVGIAGFFGVRSVQATIREGDLSRVGLGSASIVQIHDPSCGLCATLQKQTRRALKAFDEDRYEFLVADVKTGDGALFAATYNAPITTLLLFDGAGELVEVVRGPIPTGQLKDILEAHMKTHGRKRRRAS
jgi:hypothetical protein